MTGRDTKAQRIIVVSNRLPFTVVEENGEIQFNHSIGGVATGLRSVLSSGQSSLWLQPEYTWLGWPGRAISPGLQEKIKSNMLSKFHSYPVFLSEKDIEDFYKGFCNETIWPLFHYFPFRAKYDPGNWVQYKKVNSSFSKALLEVVREDDIVWIHDYHLMLLPSLVRSQLSDLRIGFFLHIPFPQFEIFRLLPAIWRREILEGLLGADLIGFHTHDYAEYFLRCVQRLLGHEHHMGQLLVDNRRVKVNAFPMGIDFNRFYSAAGHSTVQKEKAELQKTLGDSKVILSVDRQDYSKGIIHRLQGFQTMLEMNPEWHGKVTLIMVVVPSRIGIEDYEGMKKQIEEFVGKINGKFGTIGWVPIIYQYRALPFDTLVAMYAMSHIALVTPLRDGMNLVAKEYIASRNDQTGVLVLSEMAGAAKELAEAIIINPNNREEIAEALKTALEMPCEEQIRRNKIMQSRLRRHDVARWAMDFLGELISISTTNEESNTKWFSSSARSALIQQYHEAAHRLLLFDYDGTLISFAQNPELARPTVGLLRILRSLADDPKNEVILVTGRDRATIEDWFGALPIALTAEHGVWFKERNGNWKVTKSLASDWKGRLLPILEMYADRVPGAFVEKKDFSLVWHYRGAAPEQGTSAARELTDHLLAFTSNIDVEVLQGSKIVEVRNAGVNKGRAIEKQVSKGDFDFILAVGDDWTDEDMFTILPERAYSFRVGISRTHAQFHLRDPGEVLQLLEELVIANNGTWVEA